MITTLLCLVLLIVVLLQAFTIRQQRAHLRSNKHRMEQAFASEMRARRQLSELETRILKADERGGNYLLHMMANDIRKEAEELSRNRA